uniref:E3 ubiquitin-protein ligase n=1 Tax=Macrostomum lignano TaxID=282301 RepID=A0A1I8F8F7_9PLAT
YSGYRDGGLAVQRSRESDKPGKPETRRLPGSGGVIRDSRCTAFKKFPNLFNEPLVCLMSPEQIPNGRQSGSLFTLFLHCPLSGMAHPAYLMFLPRRFSCAPCCFASCSVALALRLHPRDFQPPRCYPTAHPALPDDLLDVDSVAGQGAGLAELFDAGICSASW